jgi:hypothetical protein
MTLKIDRQSSGDELVVRLIGNLGVEHLPEVTTEVRLEARRVVIDVSEVTLISIEGIRLLNACEDDGIAVINASPYILEWLALERRVGPPRR